MRIFLMLLTLLSPAPPQSAAATAEQEVRAFEQQYNAAYAANDLPAYFSYLAPDFIQWLPSGRTDKASYEKSWTRFITGGGKVTSVDLTEMQIKIGPSGDTAVASYLLHVKTHSTRGDGDDTYQETDVLFKRAGVWKVAYLHYSTAPQSKAP